MARARLAWGGVTHARLAPRPLRPHIALELQEMCSSRVTVAACAATMRRAVQAVPSRQHGIDRCHSPQRKKVRSAERPLGSCYE